MDSISETPSDEAFWSEHRPAAVYAVNTINTYAPRTWQWRDDLLAAADMGLWVLTRTPRFKRTVLGLPSLSTRRAYVKVAVSRWLRANRDTWLPRKTVLVETEGQKQLGKTFMPGVGLRDVTGVSLSWEAPTKQGRDSVEDEDFADYFRGTLPENLVEGFESYWYEESMEQTARRTGRSLNSIKKRRSEFVQYMREERVLI